MKNSFQNSFQNSNLERLRVLVDTLESQKNDSKEYTYILNEIEDIIKEERKIIGKLKKSDSKIKHYESICASILSVISATKI